VGAAGDEPPEAEMPVMLRQQHLLQKRDQKVFKPKDSRVRIRAVSLTRIRTLFTKQEDPNGKRS
jgi:hypothetical protein